MGGYAANSVGWGALKWYFLCVLWICVWYSGGRLAGGFMPEKEFCTSSPIWLERNRRENWVRVLCFVCVNALLYHYFTAMIYDSHLQTFSTGPAPFCPFFGTMLCCEVAFPLIQTSPFSPVMPKYAGLIFCREVDIWPVAVLRETVTIQVSKEVIQDQHLFCLSSSLFLNLDHYVGSKPFQSRCGAKSAPVLRDAGDSESPKSWFPYTTPFPGLSQQVIAIIVPRAVTAPR